MKTHNDFNIKDCEYCRRLRYLSAWVVLFVGILLCQPSGPVAAEGSIDPSEKYAWSSQSGWFNFNSSDGEVTVVPDGADGYLKGLVWAENTGWVKLGAGEGDGPYSNSSGSDWGVNLDSAGNLSGYGWSGTTGWTNFAPSHGGVSIDMETGNWTGFAWSENLGWISFRGTSPDYGVMAELGSDPPTPPARPSHVEHWTLLE